MISNLPPILCLACTLFCAIYLFTVEVGQNVRTVLNCLILFGAALLFVMHYVVLHAANSIVFICFALYFITCLTIGYLILCYPSGSDDSDVLDDNF